MDTETPDGYKDAFKVNAGDVKLYSGVTSNSDSITVQADLVFEYSGITKRSSVQIAKIAAAKINVRSRIQLDDSSASITSLCFGILVAAVALLIK